MSEILAPKFFVKFRCFSYSATSEPSNISPSSTRSMRFLILSTASLSGYVTYTEIPRTQPVTRDLALLVDKSIRFTDIEAVIRSADRKLLREVKLFDVYEGKNLPEGKKSYAVSMTLQDNEKTLNDKQIDAVMAKIIKAVEKMGAELRWRLAKNNSKE